jgi:hypothetical protein
MSFGRQILAALQYGAADGSIPRRIAMAQGIETDALIETTKPEAEEPRIPSAPAHPVTGEPAAFDPNDPNPPAPPTPRAPSQTDSGFGSFG